MFLWTAAALACTDLILNGTLERHPDLRIGIVELTAVWVPMFLMMLDGGSEFTARLNGRPLYPLRMKPSEYFRRQVRVSSFSYELPGRLIRQTGDLYMCCSDYPHSEGTATPLADYEGSAKPVRPDRRAGPVPRQRLDAARTRLTTGVRPGRPSGRLSSHLRLNGPRPSRLQQVLRPTPRARSRGDAPGHEAETSAASGWVLTTPPPTGRCSIVMDSRVACRSRAIWESSRPRWRTRSC